MPFFWPFLANSNGLGWEHMTGMWHVSFSTLLLLCSAAVWHYVRALLSCLWNETLPQSLTVFYVTFSFHICLHFIKNKPQCFLAVFEVILYLYYCHFISSWNQTGVFYIELQYCSLWLFHQNQLTTNTVTLLYLFYMQDTIPHFCSQHFMLLKTSILVKINFNAFWVYLMYYYWYFVSSWK